MPCVMHVTFWASSAYQQFSGFSITDQEPSGRLLRLLVLWSLAATEQTTKKSKWFTMGKEFSSRVFYTFLHFDSVLFCSRQACNVKSDQKLEGLLFARREHFSVAPEKSILLDQLLYTQTS